MKVRQARIEDLESLASFDAVARGDQGRAEALKQAIAREQCLVCEDATRIVGYGMLDYSFYDCGFIRLVYVRPDYRRHSVGSTLVQALEERCRTAKLFTSTNQSNDSMRALLAKLGYVRSGFIDNLDPGDPELIYFKPLHTNRVNTAAAAAGGHDAAR